MLRLEKLRNSMQGEELMDAIAKSKYSSADIIKMFMGKNKIPEKNNLLP